MKYFLLLRESHVGLLKVAVPCDLLVRRYDLVVLQLVGFHNIGDRGAQRRIVFAVVGQGQLMIFNRSRLWFFTKLCCCSLGREHSLLGNYSLVVFKSLPDLGDAFDVLVNRVAAVFVEFVLKLKFFALLHQIYVRDWHFLVGRALDLVFFPAFASV